MSQTNPVRVNPLGQIADGVVEQLKSAAQTTAQQVITEPAKILEQILGGKPAQGPAESGSHEAGGSAPTAIDPQQIQAEYLRKQQESNAKTQALYNLHQQRLQEEKQYYAKTQQIEEQKKEQEKQQEDQKQHIVQLRREKEKDEVWQQQLKSVQGSHEGQTGKM